MGYIYKTKFSHIKEDHCYECGNLNNLFKNYVHIRSDGTISIGYLCSECNRLRKLKYRKTPEGREKTYKAVYKSIKKYPKRQKARVIVSEALRTGKLVKPIKCEHCKLSLDLYAHHHDYTKPLEIKWLCRSCHCLEHKNLV